jgi:3-methyladenine DNA glycosylase AlkC
MPTEPHPAQRFRAPTSITAGVPLKRLLDRHAVVLLGESFAAVVPGFDARRFRGQALRGLQPLELMERAAHLARALGAQLPQDFAQAGPLVIASLGPPLTTTAGNGLAPFFYLPHSQLIATQGLESPEVGLQACYALTRRFTAEFAIRPYLLQHRELTLQMLATWVSDPDPHVRRLVSEGTRPRLPWAMRLPPFQRDPAPVLPLLERLRDDHELYVRRSVANHLGDIAKDHPQRVFELCRRWLTEVADQPPALRKARHWLIRHAVRLPAKQGVAAALALRAAAH